MKKTLAFIRRRAESARLDRLQSAVIQGRFGERRYGAHTPGRPPYHRPLPRRTDAHRYGGPRYVRDGDVITILPAAFAAGRDAGRCVCTTRPGTCSHLGRRTA